MNPQPYTPEDLAALRKQILARYNDDELRTLCADFGIEDYHDLPAETRAGRARELVVFLERRDRLPELENILASPRPADAKTHSELDGKQQRAPRNRQAMPQLVHNPWVKGVLFVIFAGVILFLCRAFVAVSPKITLPLVSITHAPPSSPPKANTIAPIIVGVLTFTPTPTLTPAPRASNTLTLLAPTSTPMPPTANIPTPPITTAPPMPTATNIPIPIPLPTSTLPPTTLSSSTPAPTNTPIPAPTRTPAPIGMVMVTVPSGSFGMGSTEAESTADANERPMHTVKLDGFQIDKTEVTNAQYQRCVEAGTCQAPQICGDEQRWLTYGDPSKADYPVACVTWQDANTYCTWDGKRLPTEAQWEYAARGTDRHIYPWGNETPTCERARYAGCGQSTLPVNSFLDSASWCGALNMAGNVSEWVEDSHDSYPSTPPPLSINPTAAARDSNKVSRGGDWHTNPYDLRTARRIGQAPTRRYSYLGFRCVKP